MFTAWKRSNEHLTLNRFTRIQLNQSRWLFTDQPVRPGDSWSHEALPLSLMSACRENMELAITENQWTHKERLVIHYGNFHCGAFAATCITCPSYHNTHAVQEKCNRTSPKASQLIKLKTTTNIFLKQIKHTSIRGFKHWICKTNNYVKVKISLFYVTGTVKPVLSDDVEQWRLSSRSTQLFT